MHSSNSDPIGLLRAHSVTPNVTVPFMSHSELLKPFSPNTLLTHLDGLCELPANVDPGMNLSKSDCTRPGEYQGLQFCTRGDTMHASQI